jgi:hypothetical protein
MTGAVHLARASDAPFRKTDLPGAAKRCRVGGDP